MLGMPIPSASAQPCPDVEVIFARGTAEPPGVGGVGQAFVDAVRSQAGNRSVEVYPVNYPASSDFGDPMAFAATVVEGIRDAGAHVESTAANCPKTRMVLGGYSQGAAVAGFVTSAAVPPGVPADLVPAPMPPEVADHVAAVALFGKPSDAWTGPVRRTADCDRPGLCGEDHPVVRSRRHDLRRHTRRGTDVRARAVSGERDGRRGRHFRCGSALAHGRAPKSGISTSAGGSAAGGGARSDAGGIGAAGGGAPGPGAPGARREGVVPAARRLLFAAPAWVAAR